MSQSMTASTGQGNTTGGRAPVRPLLRYHGGKWMLAPWILRHFPSHGRYIEPFCGAGSVFMRKRPVKVEVLNDRNGRLMNVFEVLRDPVKRRRLAGLLRYTPYSKDEYLGCRESAKDPVEDARRVLVLGHQGHGSTGATGGKLTGWRRGVRETGANSAGEWKGVWRLIDAWADRIRGVYLESLDALDVIRQWDSPESLFYVDPPYLQETRTTMNGYRFEMTDADHVALSKVLNSVWGMVVLSGFPSSLYDGLYPGWGRVERPALADKAKVTREVLWINRKALDGLGTGNLSGSPGLKVQMELF